MNEFFIGHLILSEDLSDTVRDRDFWHIRREILIGDLKLEPRNLNIQISYVMSVLIESAIRAWFCTRTMEMGTSGSGATITSGSRFCRQFTTTHSRGWATLSTAIREEGTSLRTAHSPYYFSYVKTANFQRISCLREGRHKEPRPQKVSYGTWVWKFNLRGRETVNLSTFPQTWHTL